MLTGRLVIRTPSFFPAMSSDPERDPIARITASPGSPEYEEQMLAQGQAAMDRALAMPVVRLFFGLFFALMAVQIADSVLTSYFEGGSLAVIRDADVLLGADIGMMIGAGAIAFTGRARRKWFYDIFRRKPTVAEILHRDARAEVNRLTKV